MASLTRRPARTTWVALRTMALLTILLGVGYVTVLGLIGR